MATKNIARSVIEGGRARGNKFDRRYSHKEERADTRLFLGKVARCEDVDDAPTPPKRRVVYKGFDDRLNPVWRFLDANVGRSWAKVYSEIRKKFDDRTTAGRHILFDHMLRDVKGSGQQEEMYKWSTNRDRYFVDKRGILRKDPKLRDGGKRIQNKPSTKKEAREWWQGKRFVPSEICDWIGKRAIRKHGQKLYWLEPVTDERFALTYRAGNWSWGHQFRYVRVDGKGKPILEDPKQPADMDDKRWAWIKHLKKPQPIEFEPRWRQGRELDPEDLEYFDSLPEYAQKAIVR